MTENLTPLVANGVIVNPLDERGDPVEADWQAVGHLGLDLDDLVDHFRGRTIITLSIDPKLL